MASFPSTLPGTLIASHSFTTRDNTVRSDMESGPPRVRRISTAESDTIPLNWIFTDAQMEIFRDWFKSDAGANGGAAWFTMSVNTGYGNVVQELRFKSGSFKSARAGFDLWSVASEAETR